jgi:hypothetical protein
LLHYLPAGFTVLGTTNPGMGLELKRLDLLPGVFSSSLCEVTCGFDEAGTSGIYSMCCFRGCREM